MPLTANEQRSETPMKPLSTRYLPGVAAVMIAASACLVVAQVVEAQTPPAPRAGDARPPMPPSPDGKMGPGGPGMQGMHKMREVERLKTSLQLNAQQAAVWDRAVAQMKPQGDRRDMREQMKARHDRMAAMLDDPNFDPRRLAAEMDRVGAERKARMTTIRDAWFAVYDVLNPVQRGQVREFLRERMTRHHGMHGGMHGDRGGPGGEWMHHGQPPMMAPPAPPPVTR
jgi:Spy/CpxP family protein refolding chaperone